MTPGALSGPLKIWLTIIAQPPMPGPGPTGNPEDLRAEEIEPGNYLRNYNYRPGIRREYNAYNNIYRLYL